MNTRFALATNATVYEATRGVIYYATTQAFADAPDADTVDAVYKYAHLHGTINAVLSAVYSATRDITDEVTMDA